jgi:hypothetical protein
MVQIHYRPHDQCPDDHRNYSKISRLPERVAGYFKKDLKMDNQRKVIIPYDEYEKMKHKAAKKQVDYVLTINGLNGRDLLSFMDPKTTVGYFVSENEVLVQAIEKCNAEVESIRETYKVKAEKIRSDHIEIIKGLNLKIKKKAKRDAIIWVISTVICFGCYFIAKYKGMI